MFKSLATNFIVVLLFLLSANRNVYSTNRLSDLNHTENMNNFKIELNDIFLYKLFKTLNENLTENITEKNLSEEYRENLVARHLFFEKITKLFELIVKLFNDSPLQCDLKLKFKFFSCYNHFESFESFEQIKPNDLRNFAKKLEKFDLYIKNRCSKIKSNYTNEEQAVIENIIKLNEMMSMCSFSDSIFNISISDRVIDTIFTRPKEWIKKHTFLAAGVGLALGSAVVYFYIWPKYLEQYYWKWKLRNKNKKYKIIQYVCPNQSDCDCGLWAILLAELLNRTDKMNVDDIGIIKEYMSKNKYAYEKLSNDIWSADTSTEKTWHYAEQLEGITTKLGINNRIQIIPAPQVVREKNPIDSMAYNTKHLDFGHLKDNFKAENPQTFILNAGNHWIAACRSRDNCIRIGNSYGNNNITDSSVITDLARTLGVKEKNV
jgi:hypothetical protein